MRPLSVLVALLVFAGCASDEEVRGSDVYRQLASEAARLEADNSDLLDDIAELQASIAAAQDVVGNDDPAAIESEVGSLETDRSQAESQRTAALDERNAAESALDAFKRTDAAFQRHLGGLVDDAVDSACDDALTVMWTGTFDYDSAYQILRSRQVDDIEFLSSSRSVESEATACFEERLFSDSTKRQHCSTISESDLEWSQFASAIGCVHGFGTIVQFDTFTGKCAFHANVGSYQTSWYNYAVRVQFGVTDQPSSQSSATSCSWLSEVGEFDDIEFWAFGVGSVTYSTSFGSNTIPAFRIVAIRYWQ